MPRTSETFFEEMVEKAVEFIRALKTPMKHGDSAWPPLQLGVSSSLIIQPQIERDRLARVYRVVWIDPNRHRHVRVIPDTEVHGREIKAMNRLFEDSVSQLAERIAHADFSLEPGDSSEVTCGENSAKIELLVGGTGVRPATERVRRAFHYEISCVKLKRWAKIDVDLYPDEESGQRTLELRMGRPNGLGRADREKAEVFLCDWPEDRAARERKQRRARRARAQREAEAADLAGRADVPADEAVQVGWDSPEEPWDSDEPKRIKKPKRKKDGGDPYRRKIEL